MAGLISGDLWQPSRPAPLHAGEVVVWRMPLSPRADDLALLSEDERLRHAALRNPADQRAYAAARAALRRILAGVSRQLPQDLLFGYTPARKPVLVWPAGGPEFSLAHTGDTALVAVSRAGPVGVDIECPDPSLPFLDIAAQEFSPQETAWLQALPQALQLAAFTRLWVRKEACGKYTGQGLWGGLREPLARDGDAGRWLDLALPGGEIGALAIEGAPLIRCVTLTIS